MEIKYNPPEVVYPDYDKIIIDDVPLSEWSEGCCADFIFDNKWTILGTHRNDGKDIRLNYLPYPHYVIYLRDFKRKILPYCHKYHLMIMGTTFHNTLRQSVLEIWRYEKGDKCD